MCRYKRDVEEDEREGKGEGEGEGRVVDNEEEDEGEGEGGVTRGMRMRPRVKEAKDEIWAVREGECEYCSSK